MNFQNVIKAIVSSQIDIEKWMLINVAGMSERSARDLSGKNIPIISKRFSHIKNRLKYASLKSDVELIRFAARNAYEAFEAMASGNAFKEVGAIDGYQYSIEQVAKEHNLDIAAFEGIKPCFFYSLSFIDAATLPLINCTDETYYWKNVHNAFPYNVIPSRLAHYYMEKTISNGEHHPSDPRLVRVLYESLVAFMAAMYLDIEASIVDEGSGDMKKFRRGIREAWSSENSSAYFFIFWRQSSGHKTHEEFYEAISTNSFLDQENLKRNFKRWCQEGRIANNQWKRLAGTSDDSDFEVVLLRMKYTFVSLLDNIKDFAVEHGYRIDVETFLGSLDRWAVKLKTQFPVGSWQPHMATNS